MTKDKRYKTVRLLISGGHVKTLIEIFDTIPKSVVADDLGISGDRFTKMINDVDRFNLGKLFRIADLIEVDGQLILTLVYNQHTVDKRTKKKKE